MLTRDMTRLVAGQDTGFSQSHERLKQDPISASVMLQCDSDVKYLRDVMFECL